VRRCDRAVAELAGDGKYAEEKGKGLYRPCKGKSLSGRVVTRNELACRWNCRRRYHGQAETAEAEPPERACTAKFENFCSYQVNHQDPLFVIC